MAEDTWKNSAACRPEKGATVEEKRSLVTLMFPEADAPDDSFEVLRAKQVCEPCPVKAPCLAFALANKEPEGVWGGLSPRERKKLVRDAARRRRKGVAASA